MATVTERLRELRKSLNVSQDKLAKLLGISQSAVNRYEQGQAEPPQKVLLRYADYFDVSMDYIFGRCNKPQGKLYKNEPEILKAKLSKHEDWSEFVEMCFAPNSTMNNRLKEMMINMAGGQK
jgi:transcriptional regulator with XRE-family HTH domain